MEINKKSSRHTGIELLRIISMLMVLSLHFFMKGNYNSSETEIVNVESWFVICLSIVAVNCYVLISGYFLSTKPFQLRRITNTYVQVWFYSVVIFICFVVFGVVDFSIGGTANAIMPFVFENYWFVNVYILLLLISPLLNSAINSMDKRKFKLVLVVLVTLFCIINTIIKPLNPFDKTKGFGLVWFIVLYVTAAYIRRFYKPSGKSLKFFLLYLVTAILNFFWHYLFINSSEFYWNTMVVDYNNILVYFGAVFLFLTFININFKNLYIRKIILLLSPLTFAVYLIHENPLLSELLWNTINLESYCVNNFAFIFFAFGIILLIFICCCLIEFLRQKIFKLLHINEALNNISGKVEIFVRNKVDKIL